MNQGKDVTVKIEGIHKDALSGEVQSTSYLGKGRFFERGDSFLVFYTETDDDKAKTDVRLTVRKTNAELKREGNVSCRFLFSEGENTQTRYRTPFGDMPMEIETKKYHMNMSGNTLDVHVEYSLIIDGTPSSDCEIIITIE